MCLITILLHFEKIKRGSSQEVLKERATWKSVSQKLAIEGFDTCVWAVRLFWWVKTGSVQSNLRYKYQWRADVAHFLYEGSIMPLFRILIVVRVQIEKKIDFLDLIWYTQKRFYPLIYRLLHHLTHHQWLFVIQKTKNGGVKNWKGGKKLFEFETCIIKTVLNVNKQH